MSNNYDYLKKLDERMQKVYNYVPFCPPVTPTQIQAALASDLTPSQLAKRNLERR